MIYKTFFILSLCTSLLISSCGEQSSNPVTSAQGIEKSLVKEVHQIATPAKAFSDPLATLIRDKSVREIMKEYSSQSSAYFEHSLIYAAHFNKSNTLNYLLGKGLDVNTKMKLSPNKFTDALRESIGNSDLITKMLLNKNANPNSVLGQQMNAIHFAAGKASPEVFQLLHKSGGKLDTYNAAVQFQDLISWAIANDNTQNLKYLFEEDAPYKAKNHRTKIHIAVEQGAVNCLHFLLGQKEAADGFDGAGNTPLMLVFENKTLSEKIRKDIVHLLISAGANPELQNADGKSFLDLCLENGMEYF